MLGVLLAAQGLVGSVQYELKLPSDMVWVHVALATLTWLAVLWAVAAAGSLQPRQRRRRRRPSRRWRPSGSCKPWGVSSDSRLSGGMSEASQQTRSGTACTRCTIGSIDVD